MAYSEKYRIDISNLKGQNIRVSILKDGYTGTIISINEFPSRNFANIRFDNNSIDIATPIRAQIFELDLFLKDIELNDFLEAQSRDIKVLITEGTQTHFIGYFEPIDNVQFALYGYASIRLVFTDGLTQLKNISPNWQIKDIDKNINLKLAIYYCLDVLNFENDIRLINGVDTFKFGGEPYWENCYNNKAAYLDQSGVYKNAWDILFSIMAKMGVTLFQRDGEWWVINMYESQLTTHKSALLEYGNFGTGDTWVNYDIVATDLITTQSNVSGRDLTALLNNKLVNVSQKSTYGTLKHIINNWLFDLWSNTTTLINWNPDNLNILQHTLLTSDFSCYLQGYYNASEGATSDGRIIGTTIPVNKGDRIKLGYQLRVLQPIGSETPTGRVSVMLSVTATSSFLYLKEDGTWSSTAEKIRGLTGDDYASGQSFIEVPETGTIELSVYKPLALTATGQSQSIYYLEALYATIILIGGSKNDEFAKYTGTVVETIIPNDFSNKKDEVFEVAGFTTYELPEYLVTDIKSNDYVTIDREEGGKFLVDIYNPNMFSTGNYYQLKELINITRLLFYQKNRVFIAGTFYAQEFKVGNTYNYDFAEQGIRKFVCISLAWDIRNNQYSAQLQECDCTTTLDVNDFFTTINQLTN